MKTTLPTKLDDVDENGVAYKIRRWKQTITVVHTLYDFTFWSFCAFYVCVLNI